MSCHPIVLMIFLFRLVCVWWARALGTWICWTIYVRFLGSFESQLLAFLYAQYWCPLCYSCLAGLKFRSKKCMSIVTWREFLPLREIEFLFLFQFPQSGLIVWYACSFSYVLVNDGLGAVTEPWLGLEAYYRGGLEVLTIDYALAAYNW